MVNPLGYGGLGAGLGSVRASNWLIACLGSIGALGTFLFVAFLTAFMLMPAGPVGGQSRKVKALQPISPVGGNPGRRIALPPRPVGLLRKPG